MYLTYRSRYENDFFDAFIWLFWGFIGLLLFCRTVFKDFIQFQKEKRLKNFSLTFVIIAFVSIIIFMQSRINSEFGKPSLLKIYYDGDYNGTSFDLKRDGTYIFDNSAIGMSSYIHGSYTITGNLILLDRKNLDDVIVTGRLEIRDDPSSKIPGKIVIQVDSNGNVVDKYFTFRVIEDNR